MDKENIKVEITINAGTFEGSTRRFQGDYDTMYNKDWSEAVQVFIEDLEDFEKTKDTI